MNDLGKKERNLVVPCWVLHLSLMVGEIQLLLD